MQKIILTLLALLAKSIVKFHKPFIIGVTGTVGKTTVTSHIHGFLSSVLANKRIGHSQDHYNGEYGLPLTILRSRTGGKNPIKWIWVFCVGISQFFRKYPEYLVLEYGIDHPGEMDFLLSIAIPDIAILTEVSPNHLEQFGTFDAYKREKLKITHKTKKLIVHDTLRDSVGTDAIFYGAGAMSDIDISHVQIEKTGTTAIVHLHKSEYPITVHAFGVFHVVNILPLYAIAKILELPPESVAPYITQTRSEPGRSRILEGVGSSSIIDGSYNGGYLSLHGGIASMRSLMTSHRLVFLIGDMRELGVDTESMHKKLADEICSMFPHGTSDISWHLVGPYMQEYVYPILSQKFTTKSYLSSREAGKDIKDILLQKQEKPSMVFVKGSQNTIFLEEAVEILLAHKEDVSQLCRQTPEWKKKKDVFFDSMK